MNYEVADHLDKQDQQSQGSFYTPQELAEKMARELRLKESDRSDWSDFRVLDPTVGKGNLFVAVLNEYSWLTNDNLYGCDIDEEAIRFCIEKFPGGHFQVGDCLKDDITDDEFWAKDPFSKHTPKLSGRVFSSGLVFGVTRKS
jgi:hypothetical protein